MEMGSVESTKRAAKPAANHVKNENEIKNIYHLEQSQIEIILAKSWHHISLRKIMEEDENGNIQEVLQWYFEV